MKALVDSGCFVSIVHSRLLRNCSGESRLLAFNGTEVKCRGKTRMEVIVGDMKITINAIVSDSLFGDTMMLMGMDVINQLGGVTIFRESVIFGKISEIKMGINRQEKPKEGVGCGAVYNVDRGVVKEMTEDAGGECERISDVDFEALFHG